MNKILVLLIIFLSCYGCKKENPPTSSSGLIGEWTWLISCGGFAGCSTPKSTNSTIILVFTIDSMFNIYQNGALNSSTRFYVSKLISDDNMDTTDVLTYDIVSADFSIIHDTLSLSYLDGIFQSTYKRIK